jgi:hypothetical protein
MAVRKLARQLLSLALCIPVVIVVIGCLEPEITIDGTVTNYSLGEPLEAAEVALYTYQPSALESRPPVGTKLATTTTDAQGALRALTQNTELQRAMVAGDVNKTLGILRQFYEANPGLYSIQWG